MPRPVLCWLDAPGLQGLEPKSLAGAAGLELDRGGQVEAAVVNIPEVLAPADLRVRLLGLPVQWLDLAAEVGGGDAGHRMARAAVSLARAAGRASLGTLAPVYSPQPDQRVLVAGQGLAALAVARQAALLGHPVLLATPAAQAAAAGADEDPAQVALLAAELPEGIEVAPLSELCDLIGAGGAFQAWIQGPQGKVRRRYGAVVLAPPGHYAMEPPPPGLDASLVRPLSACDPQSLPARDGWRQVAVMVGVGGPAAPEAFSRALVLALALQEQPRVQVTL